MDDSTTLREIKTFLQEHFSEGVSCPACGQLVKRYERKITSSMTLALFLLYHHHMQIDPNSFVHIPSFLASHKTLPNRLLAGFHGGDYAKLRYWGFIQGKDEMRDDESRRNGYWKITELGCRFVRGETKVPKVMYVFNEHTFGNSGELVTVEECLRNRFNYGELMGVRL